MPLVDEDKYREYRKRWYQANKKRVLSGFRLQKFGITEEQYLAMVAAQDGKCAICKRSEPGGRGAWHVDHDHVTTKVRALLCHSCNVALGHLKDSPVIIAAALEYIQRHQAEA